MSLTTLSEEVFETILEYLSIVETVRIRRVCRVLHTTVSNTGLSPIPLHHDNGMLPFQNVTHTPVTIDGGLFFEEIEVGDNNTASCCLRLSMSPESGGQHAWTSSSLRLPVNCNAAVGTRRWKSVLIRTRMKRLRPNGGYCSIKLVKNDHNKQGGMRAATATATTTEDYYEIKFDENRLRGYGVCTNSDFDIPVPSVRRMGWFQLLVELVPFSLDDDMDGRGSTCCSDASDASTTLKQLPAQGIRISINGVHIKTAKLHSGNYAGICDVVFKGYRSDGFGWCDSQWWDSPIWVVGERPALK